jgi:hypothetical protein
LIDFSPLTSAIILFDSYSKAPFTCWLLKYCSS